MVLFLNPYLVSLVMEQFLDNNGIVVLDYEHVLAAIDVG